MPSDLQSHLRRVSAANPSLGKLRTYTTMILDVIDRVGKELTSKGGGDAGAGSGSGSGTAASEDEDPYEVQLMSVLSKLRSISVSGLPGAVMVARQQVFEKCLETLCAKSAEFGVTSDQLRAMIMGESFLPFVFMDVPAVQWYRKPKPSDLPFEVQFTLERGIMYCSMEVYSSSAPSCPTDFKWWGTYVLTGIDMKDIPRDFVVVDNLDDKGTMWLVTLPMSKAITVMKGHRKVLWSASEVAQAPWGTQWCHISDTPRIMITIHADMDALHEAHPELGVYMVLKSAPSMIVARVPSPQEQLDMYDATKALYVNPTPDLPPAATWVIVSTNLATVAIADAVISKFLPDECVWNPDDDAWTSLCTNHEEPKKRLVLVVKPCLSLPQLQAIVDARTTMPRMNIVFLATMMDTMYGVVDFKAADVAKTFLKGVPIEPHVHVAVIRNIVRVLQVDEVWL